MYYRSRAKTLAPGGQGPKLEARSQKDEGGGMKKEEGGFEY
ncbi:hypothetical protein ACFLU5_00885 [Bacteroidota bacterium]